MTEAEQLATWMASERRKRQQRTLAGIVGTEVVVGAGAVLFMHNLLLAVLAFGLAALCGGLWVVRRARYAKGS